MIFRKTERPSLRCKAEGRALSDVNRNVDLLSPSALLRRFGLRARLCGQNHCEAVAKLAKKSREQLDLLLRTPLRECGRQRSGCRGQLIRTEHRHHLFFIICGFCFVFPFAGPLPPNGRKKAVPPQRDGRQAKQDSQPQKKQPQQEKYLQK